MKDLKLKCLIKGYEDTFFEVGQVWETREGNKLKIIGFDLKTPIYKVSLFELEDEYKNHLYYTQKGEFWEGEKNKRDLVKLITENSNIDILSALPQTESSNQQFLVYVHGKNAPKRIHDLYDSAEKEAKRLAEKEIGYNVSIVNVVKTFKSKVIVEEVEI